MDPDDEWTPEQLEIAASRRQALVEFSFVMFVVVYVLLQKKVLPKKWWLPLTRLYFYPMILPNYLWHLTMIKGTYFSRVDDVLLLGAVPLVFAGHIKELHRLGVRAVVVRRRSWAMRTARARHSCLPWSPHRHLCPS